MTSKNIMLVHDDSERDFKPSIMYKAQGATNHEHEIHTIVIRFNDDGVEEGFLPYIVMELYANVSYYEDWNWPEWNSFWSIWYWATSKIRRWRRRIRASFKLLCTGWVEEEASFLFMDEKAIEDYIKALNEGLRKMRKAKVVVEKVIKEKKNE